MSNIWRSRKFAQRHGDKKWKKMYRKKANKGNFRKEGTWTHASTGKTKEMVGKEKKTTVTEKKRTSTKKEVQTTRNSIHIKREYNREKKREERAKMSYQKKMWIQKRDRERKLNIRVMKKKQQIQSLDTSTWNESPFPSKKTVWNITSQVRGLLPETLAKLPKLFLIYPKMHHQGKG